MVSINKRRRNNTKFIESTKWGKEEFRQTYNRFSGRMYSLCSRYTDNSKDAGIIFNQGIITLYKQFSLSTFENREETVRKIFVNCCIEFLYKKHYSLFKKITPGIIDFSIEPGILTGITPAQLIALIQQLQPGDRVLVNLYFVEGYSIEIMSTLLGVSETAVHALLGNAATTFRNIISVSTPGCKPT